MTFSSFFLVLGAMLFSQVSAQAPSFLENSHQERSSSSLAEILQQQDAQRHLFWAIEFQPGADPDFVCDKFQEAAGGKYECSCDIQPDKTVGLKCLELEETCNDASKSICFKQNIIIGLTDANVIKELESCTEYSSLNLTSMEGSSTKLANYSSIMPCVKVHPSSPGDFTKIDSCEASINGAPCHKCEMCTVEQTGGQGISMDCCNTNPNGEQLKVECGPVGGGGAFAPFFETYEEGKMGKCSGSVSDFSRIVFGLLTVMTVAAVLI